MHHNSRMELWTAPVVDVRPLLTRERGDLLSLIAGLTDDEWFSPSRVPGWTVKDLALHILDDDLGWLSRGRDQDPSGRLIASDSDFVDALNRKNQKWVEATRQMSRPVVRGLLEWAGRQMDSYYAGQSLTSPGRVAWASDDPVPNWFDIAQDLTERWVHQMQMRDALGRVEAYRETYVGPVMDTFIWAFPHQYRVVASRGSRVRLDLGAGRVWALTSDGTRWQLGPAADDVTPVAEIHADHDTGWRWLSGGALREGDLRTSGPEEFVQPLLAVRAVLG